jgi:hypothetical protein
MIFVLLSLILQNTNGQSQVVRAGLELKIAALSIFCNDKSSHWGHKFMVYIELS